MKYGIWIESPGKWTGWFSMALGDRRYPMSFDEAEAHMRANGIRDCGLYPGLVEARPNPPAEMPWNEGEWKKATT
jgi:hypothetical protein